MRWLHWVDRIFSPYRPDSDVSLLAAAEVTVDGCAPEVAEVISACAAVRLCSGGYFTAAPGGVFDPSGYVKGWAVERAAAILAAPGRRATWSTAAATSSAPAAPRRPGSGEPWRVGIADPFHRGRLALVVEAADSAVATSGTAERGAHIIDPHLGRPATGLASLTVVGPSLALADAYATAAFAMGPARARDWTESLDGLRGLRDHRRTATPGRPPASPPASPPPDARSRIRPGEFGGVARPGIGRTPRVCRTSSGGGPGEGRSRRSTVSSSS